MPYYDPHPFSAAQAQHAASMVLDLMRYRRFFLHNTSEWNTYREEGYVLHPEVFAEAIALNEAHIAIHREARERAQDEIEQFEADNKIILPQTPKGKSVVEFSRYGGGFEICRVYPLSAFAEFVPESMEALSEMLLQERLGKETEDDIAPKLFRSYQDEASDVASIIWKQLQLIDAGNAENNRCLILMQSRINLDGVDSRGDFAQSRVWDMQSFPYAVGFLFHEYSKIRRIVQHNFVVCSTSGGAHVKVQHWSDHEGIAGELSINFKASGGYTNKVMFATVL